MLFSGKLYSVIYKLNLVEGNIVFYFVILFWDNIKYRGNFDCCVLYNLIISFIVYFIK